MRVAITGARGSIGRTLLPFLIERGHDVFAAPGKDVLDMSMETHGTQAWLASVAPDAVIHLAGAKPPAPGYMMISTNAGATHNLLRAVSLVCKQAKVLVVSSAAVLGDPPTPYGISKQITEILSDYARESGVAVSILRIANVVGAEGDSTSVVPQLYKRLREAAPDDVIEVRDADCTRDFILVDDVAEVVELLLKRSDLPHLVEVGTGEGLEIAEVARLVADAVNPAVRLSFRPFAGRGIFKSVADTSVLRAIGWRAHHGVRDSIAASVGRLLG